MNKRRSPRQDETHSDPLLASEVDSLITTMGVDPALFDVGDDLTGEPTRRAEPTARRPAPQTDQQDPVHDAGIDPEVHAAEIALVEAHAKARMAVELERIKAEAAEQRQAELAAQEAAAVAERERAVAEARAQAEAAARETMAAELARARAEVEAKFARELDRSRESLERHVSDRLGQSQAAEAARATSLQEARAEAMLEARATAEAAAGRAIEAEVARVRAETEAKLQAELNNLREQVEHARRMHVQAEQQAELAREHAAREVQAAAQRAASKAFEVEAARIRSEAETRIREESERAQKEANKRLDSEVAKIRSEADDRAAKQAALLAQATQRQEAAARSAYQERVSTSAGDEPAESSRGAWLTATAAAAAVVILGTGGYLLWSGRDAGASADVTATEVAPAEAEEVPAARGKRGRPNGDPKGAKPKGRVDATAGVPVVTASKNTPGLLTVFSRVPLDVLVDGVRVGSTEEGQMSVPAGRRKVELVNKRLNYRGDVTIDVAAGQVTTHTATLPPGQLRISGATGAEVWVEGEHVGTLPIGDVSVPLGTREVVVRHPVFGERRQTVEVTYGGPTHVTLGQQEGTGASAATDAPRLPPLSAAPSRSDAIR